MYHTDAAGVVFYANLFIMAHDCYEQWMGSYMPISEILSSNIEIPIVHAHADYHEPIRLSDEIAIQMSLVEKKQTSYTLLFTFINPAGDPAAHIKTTHVVIDSQTRKQVNIPEPLLEGLSTL